MDLRYSQFEDELVVAIYHEMQRTPSASRIFPSHQILDNYPLRFREGWVHEAVRGLSNEGLILGKGVMGDERSQPLRLTSAGLRHAERLIDEGVTVWRLDGPQPAKGVGYDDAVPGEELPAGVEKLPVGSIYMYEGEKPDVTGKPGDLLVQVAPLTDDAYAVESAIPASDRVVSLKDNELADDVRQGLSDLSTALELGNDVGELSAEEVELARREVWLIEQTFKEERVRVDFVLPLVQRTMKWIALKTADTAIGALIKATWAAIIKLVV